MFSVVVHVRNKFLILTTLTYNNTILFHNYFIPVHSLMFVIRSWPPFSYFEYFPFQWTFYYQPVYVIMSDHMTKVGNFLFFIVRIM